MVQNVSSAKACQLGPVLVRLLNLDKWLWNIWECGPQIQIVCLSNKHVLANPSSMKTYHLT